MKTKYLLLLTSLFYGIQTSMAYLPVFGDGITHYHAGGQYRSDDSGTIFSVGYMKNAEEEGLYLRANAELLGDLALTPSQIRISEDNSKLWGEYIGFEEYLIMDLNMKAGEVYTDLRGDKHTVSKVYMKDGRKHIEFDTLIPTGSGFGERIGIKEMPLMFIEGFGPNLYIYRNANTWVLSQYENTELRHGLAGWEPYWGYIGNVPAGFDTNKIAAEEVALYPNPAREQVEVSWKGYVHAHRPLLKITDLAGRLVDTFSMTRNPFPVNTARYAPGLYFLSLVDGEEGIVSKLIIK